MNTTNTTRPTGPTGPTGPTLAEKTRQLGRLCEHFWGIAADSSRMEAEELRAIGDALYDQVWKQYVDADPNAPESVPATSPATSIEDAIAREMGYEALSVFQEGVSPRRQTAYKRAARRVSALLDRWLANGLARK